MARYARVTPLLGGALVGSALAAGALLPGAGIADAAPAASVAPAAAPVAKPAACGALEDAQAALKQAKTALNSAEITWNKKLSALHAAEAKLAADPDNDALKLARDRAQAATGPAQSAYFLAKNHLYDAQATYTNAVRLADKADCGGDGGKQLDPPTNPIKDPVKPSPVKHPIDRGNGDGPGRHPGPQHSPHGPGHPGRPGPVAPAGQVSSSQASAVAVSAPGARPEITIQDVGSNNSSGSTWGEMTGWVGDWFSGDAAADAGGRPSEDVVAEHSMADGAVDGSVVPVGSVEAGDGRIDTGHIGMAVAGLGALGLAGAGTTALVGRHRRQHRS